jgi:hypothetical protein
MRTAEYTRDRARTWLDRHLTDHVARGDTSGITIGLNTPSGQALRERWPDALQWALNWRRKEPTLLDGVTLDWETRLLGSSRQELPTRLVLSNIDATATWVGDGYPERLAMARERWATLNAEFPTTATDGILRAVVDWSHVDLTLLVSTARWFAANPVADHTWTPRQVPVPGLHAKWLDAAGRRTLIAQLIDVPEIRLRTRPLQARITYLDPAHAAAGCRRWDIVTTGDAMHMSYLPTTVIIVENRDTAFYFPPKIRGGIAVLGNGDAVVNLIATVEPLMTAARVIYWGDIDAEGLRIVSRLRSRGHQLATILMDVPTYDTYERYGTRLDQHGKVIPPGDPTPPPHLTSAEAALHERLTDPVWAGHRRIEQERIPLAVAIAAVDAQSDEWGDSPR